jgi:hypothetical protein
MWRWWLLTLAHRRYLSDGHQSRRWIGSWTFGVVQSAFWLGESCYPHRFFSWGQNDGNVWVCMVQQSLYKVCQCHQFYLDQLKFHQTQLRRLPVLRSTEPLAQRPSQTLGKQLTLQDKPAPQPTHLQFLETRRIQTSFLLLHPRTKNGIPWQVTPHKPLPTRHSRWRNCSFTDDLNRTKKRR